MIFELIIIFITITDCPQVICERQYNAQQPDELSLEKSDVVNVFRKTNGKKILFAIRVSFGVGVYHGFNIEINNSCFFFLFFYD